MHQTKPLTQSPSHAVLAFAPAAVASARTIASGRAARSPSAGGLSLHLHLPRSAACACAALVPCHAAHTHAHTRTHTHTCCTACAQGRRNMREGRGRVWGEAGRQERREEGRLAGRKGGTDRAEADAGESVRHSMTGEGTSGSSLGGGGRSRCFVVTFCQSVATQLGNVYAARVGAHALTGINASAFTQPLFCSGTSYSMRMASSDTESISTLCGGTSRSR